MLEMFSIFGPKAFCMILLFDLKMPLEDPVLVFAIVLFIILFAPILLSKIKVPGIIGLIVAGAVLGPNGINLLARNSAIVLFGTVGLLYIMFVAGLEIDLNEFKKNRNKSLVFGALTFGIPLLLGSLASYYVLGYGIKSSILLASMFSTHTLVSYPIASRLGITKNEAVTITVGGTIITDTLALIILAVISGSVDGDISLLFVLKLLGAMAVFAGFVVFVFPKVARWFFRNMESEGVSQYIFVMAMVFTAAFGAELAGVEPIIGAFLAGLVLNRLIPHTSPLMNRIEFVGNALFIPFFLISVGMLVDLRVLLKGPVALVVAVTLTTVALGSKWVAAYLSQKLFKYTRGQRDVIFGLSSAHAAATIAIILIGFELELFDENVLNGTIVLILVTCVVASFVTDRAGRKLAIQESGKLEPVNGEHERILVPFSNPATIEQLVDLAIMVKNPKLNEPVYPLSVVIDDDEAREKVLEAQKKLEKVVMHAASSDHILYPVSRVDLNIASGIIRAIKELMITQIVIGWNGKTTAKERFFGSVLDNVLAGTEQMVLVTKLVYPVNTVKNMVVAIPPGAEIEPFFPKAAKLLLNLAKQATGKATFLGNQSTLDALGNFTDPEKTAVETRFVLFDDWDDFLVLIKEVSENDLFVVVNARSGSLSYSPELDRIPKHLSKHFQKISFIVLYPEQKIL